MTKWIMQQLLIIVGLLISINVAWSADYPEEILGYYQAQHRSCDLDNICESNFNKLTITPKDEKTVDVQIETPSDAGYGGCLLEGTGQWQQGQLIVNAKKPNLEDSICQLSLQFEDRKVSYYPFPDPKDASCFGIAFCSARGYFSFGVKHNFVALSAPQTEESLPTPPIGKGSLAILTHKGQVCDEIVENIDAEGRILGTDEDSSAAKNAITWFNQEDFTLDIDNDGRKDKVFQRTFDQIYMTGITLYVFLGTNTAVKKAIKSGKPYKDYSDELLKIKEKRDIPCQLENTNIPFDECPPSNSQKYDEAGFSVLNEKENKSVLYRARYTSLFPFSFNDKNYLFVRTGSRDTEKYLSVIRLLPHKKYQTSCVFKKNI